MGQTKTGEPKNRESLFKCTPQYKSIMDSKSYYGYYANHGGFANYKNGFNGLKYRKTRKDEYTTQQALAHNNEKVSEVSEPDMHYGTTPVDTIVNEIHLKNGSMSNEEMRLDATNSPAVEFVGDSKKSNVRMTITPLKPAPSGGKVAMKGENKSGW